MTRLSRKLGGVDESLTLVLSAKARRLKEAGIDVISLTAGEPDFPTPRHVKDAAIAAIESNFTRYTANEGITELLDAVIAKFSRDNGLTFGRDQILVSSGAKHAIFNALQAVCGDGDEVIILSPYWVSYPAMVRLVDAVPVIVPTLMESGFRPIPEMIRCAITAKTKAIILNSPTNPTGVVFTTEEVEAIASIVRDTNILVFSDEVYEKVAFDGRRHISIGALDGISDRVITVNGVSKAYAMTGWRIGYLGGPRDIVAAAAKVQGQTTSNANSVAQKAATAALSGSQESVDAMVTEFQRRRDISFASLSSIAGLQVFLPDGAMFFFMGVKDFLGKRYGGRTIGTSLELAHHLLDQYHVGVVPGTAFGADDCLRLSFSCPVAQLTEGLGRLKKGLEELS
jgi:aspartate aminotransferase